jgi:hypothetical protein
VIQNSKVLVISKPVLNPPQKMIPVTNETDEMAKIEYFALGFLKAFHSRLKNPGCSLDMDGSLFKSH